MADKPGTTDRRAPLASDALQQRRLVHDELLVMLSEGDAAEAVDRIAAAIAGALDDGGKVIFFGNGGSAADAIHISAEFVGRFRADRRPLAAVALGTNAAITSALANDYSFEDALARELEAVAHAGDVALAISTRGSSPNIVAALERATTIGLTTVALTGAGHKLDGLAEHLVVVESNVVALIQEMHGVIGHIICELVEAKLGLDR